MTDMTLDQAVFWLREFAREALKDRAGTGGKVALDLSDEWWSRLEKAEATVTAHAEDPAR